MPKYVTCEQSVNLLIFHGFSKPKKIHKMQIIKWYILFQINDINSKMKDTKNLTDVPIKHIKRRHKQTIGLNWYIFIEIL
jgi:hypothetical protein